MSARDPAVLDLEAREGVRGLRNRTLTLREDCNRDISSLEESMRRYGDETEILTQRLGPQGIHSSLSTHVSHLSEHAQLLEPLRSKLAIVRDHNIRLNELDVKIFIDGLDLSAGASIVGGSPSPAPVVEEYEFPEPLEEYFSVLGDINLLDEQRLHELLPEQQQLREQRQLRQDQGETVDPPDDIFESQWKIKFDDLIKERVALEEQAHVLKTRCESLGLNTDPRHYQRRGSEDANAPSALQSHVNQWLSEVRPTTSGSHSSMIDAAGSTLVTY